MKIKPKIADIAGLQVADILAYPLKEKFFHENNIRKNFFGNFNEKVYEVVKDKYNRHMFTGRIKGYGEVCI